MTSTSETPPRVIFIPYTWDKEERMTCLYCLGRGFKEVAVELPEGGFFTRIKNLFEDRYTYPKCTHCDGRGYTIHTYKKTEYSWGEYEFEDGSKASIQDYKKYTRWLEEHMAFREAVEKRKREVEIIKTALEELRKEGVLKLEIGG